MTKDNDIDHRRRAIWGNLKKAVLKYRTASSLASIDDYDHNCSRAEISLTFYDHTDHDCINKAAYCQPDLGALDHIKRVADPRALYHLDNLGRKPTWPDLNNCGIMCDRVKSAARILSRFYHHHTTTCSHSTDILDLSVPKVHGINPGASQYDKILFAGGRGWEVGASLESSHDVPSRGCLLWDGRPTFDEDQSLFSHSEILTCLVMLRQQFHKNRWPWDQIYVLVISFRDKVTRVLQANIDPDHTMTSITLLKTYDTVPPIEEKTWEELMSWTLYSPPTPTDESSDASDGSKSVFSSSIEGSMSSTQTTVASVDIADNKRGVEKPLQ